MQKINEIPKPGSLYLFAAAIVILAALSFVAAPVRAIADARENELSAEPAQVGDTWSLTLKSYRALPSWWLPEATEEARKIDPPVFDSARFSALASRATIHIRPFFQQGADLIISKSDDPDPVSAGGILTYTIIFTNVGGSVANNVRVTETYDANVTFINADPPPSNPPNIWAFVTLTRDESVAITVTVQVTDSMPTGSELTNQVTIAAPPLEGSTATATTAVTSPALSLKLDAQPDPVEAGSTLIYQIHFENQGNAPATGTAVVLIFDPLLTFDTSDLEPTIEETDYLRWNIGELDASGTSDIDVTMIVTDDVADRHHLESWAWIDSIETGPLPEDRERTHVNAPLLELTKTAVPGTASAGERLTYTLIFSNVGHADSATLAVTDAVPADTDFVSCGPVPCDFSGGIVTWQPGDLVVGGKITAALAVTVDALAEYGTVLVNTARVSEAETGAHAAIAQIETVVSSLPLLQLSISNGDESVKAGDELLYAINYANTGKGRTKDTAIVVTPPSSQLVEQVGCEPPSDCVGIPDQERLVHHIGPLRSGESGVFHLVATVKDPLPAHARSIIASAVISATSPVDPSGDTYAEDEDPIATRPDLVVEADYEDLMPWPGKQVVYALEYSNRGHIGTTGVYIDAIQHPNTKFDKSASTPGWQLVSDGRYRQERGMLGYLDSGELVFVVTLDAPFTSGMTDFDANFAIRDDGLSGLDDKPADNDFNAPLGVPNLVIETVLAQPQVWSGKPGFLWAVVKNIGSGKACGVYNPDGCTPFALDVFLDATVPPPSFPILAFGDCYVFVDPIDPGLKRTAVISFTLDPGLQFQPGFCSATELDEIWLKVDNWDPDEPPRPEEFGLVPESEENDNVFGPFVPRPPVFLPILMHNY